MIDGTTLIVGYLVASAITTTVLTCAFVVCGRTDAAIEQRARGVPPRRFTRAIVKTAHAH